MAGLGQKPLRCMTGAGGISRVDDRLFKLHVQPITRRDLFISFELIKTAPLEGLA